DERWVQERAVQAVERRKDAGIDLSGSFRVLHAEGDDLGGLVVDKLGDVLSAELYSEVAYGLWETALPVLQERLGTKHWKVAMDHSSARAEGIPVSEERSDACPARFKLEEEGVQFEINLKTGHKTGFFCDQRLNRLRIREEVKRHLETSDTCRVLDVCTYTGGFALSAAYAGATEVVGIDLDEHAIEAAIRNANLNGLRQVKWTHTDAFPWLRQAAELGKQFDLVIVDPPKFIPKRRTFDEGQAKYHDLNKVTGPLVAPGGRLVSCSCSGILSTSEFQQILRQALKRMERPFRVEDITGAGPDHPIRLDFPEGAYLKAIWMRN
ncbi:MAG: class I SAM-dependent rRNA methyltransferase, partial [Planctomycetes bacterium]|nr:class I SAM-dependent rRNA methyltransferase [Planctomycetota bacterium]